MRSAELGFYTALSAESLGGGGLGPQAAVYIQERLNAHCGPERHLVQTVVLPSPFTLLTETDTASFYAAPTLNGAAL
ncbi:hypothetical protein D3C72_2238290 [compost metagenome]